MFVIPALAAFLLKVYVIYICAHRGQVFSIFHAIVITFALHNLGEVLIIGNMQTLDVNYLLRFYYVASIVGLFFLFNYACFWINKTIKTWALSILTIVVFMIASLIMFTDTIVAGASPVSYTMTAIKGEQYFFILLSFLFFWAAIYGVLTLAYVRATSRKVQIKAAYIAIATVPLLLASLLAIVLVQMNSGYTAAIILPIGSSIFLLVLLRIETGMYIKDIGKYFADSTYRRTRNKINRICNRHLQNRVTLRETEREIQKLLVQHAISSNDNNISAAARALRLHRSTIYAILRPSSQD